MPDRDLFSDFARMRRELDTLFGDRAESGVRRRAGFVPAVDVSVVGEPPRGIVVEVELAGVAPGQVDLQVLGRQLVVSGRRAPAEAAGRTYQQVEIERGAFRREVLLPAEVEGDAARAVYDDGILRVELPLVQPPSARSVPVEVTDRKPG